MFALCAAGAAAQESPLHAAALEGGADEIKELIRKGQNVGARDDGGRTPLHIAARNGNTAAASVLIEAGADVNAKSINDTTPLHAAAQEGRENAVLILIRAGGYVNAQDEIERTPLDLAEDGGYETIAAALLRAGARIDDGDEQAGNNESAAADGFWEVDTSGGEDENAALAWAYSDAVEPLRQLKAPFDDVEALLGVACGGGEEWVYVGFEGGLKLGEEGAFRTRIRWDGETRFVFVFVDGEQQSVQFHYDKQVIRRIRSHAVAQLELPWFGQGKVNFRFPLEGARKTINRIREVCERE